MVANTWIAAAPGDWSDDANWSLGHSPIAGEDPTFDGTSVNNCNANDDTPTGVLTIGAGYSGTITQSSDMYISGYSQAGGTFIPIISKIIYLNGDFLKTSGTIPAEVGRIIIGGTDNTYSSNNIIMWYQLTIDCNLTASSTLQIGRDGAGAIITFRLTDNHVLNTNRLVAYYTRSSGIFDNDGYIIGPIEIRTTGNAIDTCQININNANSDITIIHVNAGTTNAIFKIEANIICNSLIIFSSHATCTTTLDLNGHNLTASSITVGTRGILTNSSAIKSVVRCRSLNSSAGTFTPDNILLVMEGDSALKLEAAGSVESIISKDRLTLGSDVTVSEMLAHVNPVDQGAFALTQTHPENEYTGLRRPLVRPLTKLDIGPVGPANAWMRDLGAVVG